MQQQKTAHEFQISTFGPDWIQADFLDGRGPIFLNMGHVSSVWTAEIDGAFGVFVGLDESDEKQAIAVIGRYKRESEAISAAIALIMSKCDGSREKIAANLSMLIASKIVDERYRNRLLSLVGDLARS